MEYVEIEGKQNLIRDINSRAIINTDRNELNKTLLQREKRIKESKELNNLKDEVQEIKSILNLILEKLESRN